MALKKDGVHPRREEDRTLAFLLTIAKSPKKIDITQAVRNALVEPYTSKPDVRSSHVQPSQPWRRQFLSSRSRYFAFCLFYFLNCLSFLLFLFFADMAGSSKFPKTARVIRKGKIVFRVTSPLTKRAHPLGEVIMLSPSLPPPTAEGSPHLQPESSPLGASNLPQS